MLQVRLGGPGMDGRPRMSEALRAISLEYSLAELSDATLNWSSERKLGCGSYGAVYRGELEDGSEVAVKAIDLKKLEVQGQGEEMAGFQEEVQTLSKFRHPNLVTLLGWGKRDHLRYLVYELLGGGDAFQRLAKSRRPEVGQPFYWYERLSVCLDSCTGLSHMHNHRPKAFHRDIKSANILLDRHGRAKMADFGLSCTSSGKVGDRHVQVDVVSGTPGYACPVYSRTGRVTEASEVYSFGMVMLEMLTGLAPAAPDPRRQGGIVYPIEETVSLQKPGAQERCIRSADTTARWPPDLAGELAALALRCVSATEEGRPEFKEMVRAIRSLTERYPRPTLQLQDAYTLPIAHGGLVNPAGPASPVSPISPVSPRSPAQYKVAGGSAVSDTAIRADVAAPFFLEVVAAEDISIETLPLDHRRLLLVGEEGADGSFTVPVGRQHHAERFEAWLPDLELRNCISRTAFEVSWGRSGENLRVAARGANPITVDGCFLKQHESAGVQLGSTVGFPYSSSGEQALFLLLKLLRGGGSGLLATAPPPHAGFPPSPVSGLSPMSVSIQASAPGSGRDTEWTLVCVEAEGLGPQELAALPAEVREFQTAGGVKLVGRQHQPQAFEVLLARMPSCLNFISRTHIQLEATGAVRLNLVNMGSNVVYVNNTEPLNKGESRSLVNDEVVSFARLEGIAHKLFLSLRVRAPRTPSVAEGGPSVDPRRVAASVLGSPSRRPA